MTAMEATELDGRTRARSLARSDVDRRERPSERGFWPFALMGAVVGGVVVLVALLSGPAPATGRGGEGLTEVGLDGLAEVMAAVLGLSLTVVAIAVQLAAQRSSAKVVDLFMRDPINAVAFGFMVLSSVYVVVLPALASGRPPVVAIAAAYALTVVNFGLLLPYVRHVFAFLKPDNVIRTIERAASRSLARAAAGIQGTREVAAARQSVAASIERIADTCLAAIGQQDRNLALHSVRTLERLVCRHHGDRRRLPPAWAEIEPATFASLSEGFYEEIVAQGIWVEAKTLMELEHIIRRALGAMDELVSQIASSTRVIGATALEADDDEVVRMVIRFFNTFIRHGLNAGNVRAVYNILEHLRRLAVGVLRRRTELALQIADHLRYYAHRANAAGVPFVTETIAHDVRVLCQEAHEAAGVDALPFVERFLELDQRPTGAAGELALVGVRKAQAILGAFFLAQDEPALVARIQGDMRGESRERLLRIRDEILAVTERRFWEITDRGFNFDYVEPAQRRFVRDFFAPLVGEGQAATSP